MHHSRSYLRTRRAIQSVIESLERRTLLSTYGATDLGTLIPGDSGEDVDPIDINNAGHVVGTVSLPYLPDVPVQPSRAFIYSNGHMTALPGFFADGNSYAHDINNLDEVVGNADLNADLYTAFLYTGGKMYDLQNSLPKDTPWSISDALAINDAGLILARATYSPGNDNSDPSTNVDPPFNPNPNAGDSPNPPPEITHVPVESHVPDNPGLTDGAEALILLDPATGKVTFIGTAAYDGINFATVALGENGEVAYSAGFEDTGDELITHAQYWKDGVATDLALGPDNYSTPARFNAAGSLVGYAGTDNGNHPFLYKNGRLIDLAVDFPKGFDTGFAADISDAGDIVGLIQGASPSFNFEYNEPYIYHAGHYTLINHELPANQPLLLRDVIAINRSGMMIANAQDTDGYEHAYLVTQHAPRSDDNPVRVTIASAPLLRARDTSYTFSLHFTSPFRVDPSSIVPEDVNVVSQDNGSNFGTPTVLSVVQDSDGLGLTATYRIQAPGGRFRFINNGDYDIQLGTEDTIPGVLDANANHARSQAVGHFSIALPDTSLTLPNAGRSSIAYDSTGRLHAAYYDTDDAHLKYAVRSPAGVWSAITTIDATGDVGRFLSLALDASDHPAVAYYDNSTADLKFAHFNGATWTTETIDSYHTTGGYPSLVYDANNLPAIAYWRKTSGDLRLAHFDGSMWNITTVDSPGNTGRFPSLKLNPVTHRLALAWEDHTGATFKYADENADGSYTTTIVDTTLEGGGFCSLAFNPLTNRPAFSYYESGTAVTKLAYFDGTAWLTSAIRGPYNRGLFTQLSFDNDGIPTILYYILKADAVFAAHTTVSDTAGVDFPRQISPGGLGFSAQFSPQDDLTLAAKSPDADQVKIDDLPPPL